MRKVVFSILLLMSLSANAQQRQISYVETSSSGSGIMCMIQTGRRLRRLPNRALGS